MLITETEILILQILVQQEGKPLRSRKIHAALGEKNARAPSYPTVKRTLKNLVKRGWVAAVSVDRPGEMVHNRRPAARAWSTAYIATELGNAAYSAKMSFDQQVTTRLKQAAIPEDQGVPLGDTDVDEVTLLEPIETKLHIPFLFRFVTFQPQAERYRIRVEADGEGFPAETEVRASQVTTVPNLQVREQAVVVVTSDELGFRADRCPVHFRWRVSAIGSDKKVISESKWATADVEAGHSRSDWSAVCKLLLAAGRAHEAKQQFDRALEIYSSLPDPDLRLAALIEMYQRRCKAIREQLAQSEELRLDYERQQELESNCAILEAVLEEYRRQAAMRLTQRGG